MTLDSLLALARKNLGGAMESSARLCLADAVALKDRGDFCESAERALASLRYSVGFFHADYERAERAFAATGDGYPGTRYVHRSLKTCDGHNA